MIEGLSFGSFHPYDVSFLEGEKILQNKYGCIRYLWMCRTTDIAEIIGEINRYLAFCLFPLLFSQDEDMLIDTHICSSAAAVICRRA